MDGEKHGQFTNKWMITGGLPLWIRGNRHMSVVEILYKSSNFWRYPKRAHTLERSRWCWGCLNISTQDREGGSSMIIQGWSSTAFRQSDFLWHWMGDGFFPGSMLCPRYWDSLDIIEQYHWIGLRKKQANPIFDGINNAFRLRFSLDDGTICCCHCCQSLLTATCSDFPERSYLYGSSQIYRDKAWAAIWQQRLQWPRIWTWFIINTS